MRHGPREGHVSSDSSSVRRDIDVKVKRMESMEAPCRDKVFTDYELAVPPLQHTVKEG